MLSIKDRYLAAFWQALQTERDAIDARLEYFRGEHTPDARRSTRFAIRRYRQAMVIYEAARAQYYATLRAYARTAA